MALFAHLDALAAASDHRSGVNDQPVGTSAHDSGTGRSGSTGLRLGRAGAAVGIAVLLVIVALGWRVLVYPTVAGPDVETFTVDRLAVLPFADGTGDSTRVALLSGIHSTLVADLGAATTLDVLSADSVARFSGSRLPLSEIVRELAVDAVIQGSVRQARDGFVASMALVVANPERLVWAGTYRAELEDAQELTSRVVAEIVAVIDSAAAR